MNQPSHSFSSKSPSTQTPSSSSLQLQHSFSHTFLRALSRRSFLGYDDVDDDDDRPHSSSMSWLTLSGRRRVPVLLVREEHVSLENLSPHPACRSRKSSLAIAVVNLVATVCGGGVLSLPLAFARAGIIPTIILMVYGATATDFTLYLLVACARRTGGRTYGDVAQAAFGSGASVLTTATLFFMLLGSLIAYQVLVRDVWCPVILRLVPTISHLAEYMNWSDRQTDNVLLGAILVIAFPLLLKRDLHALRHTCYVGLSSCALLMIAVIFRAVEKLHQTPRANTHQTKIKWYSTNPTDLMFAFPIVALCFFCSYNILSIHAQLVHPTRSRVRVVLDTSILICFVLFGGVGLCGYLYAGDMTADNILLNFAVDDPAILAGRTGYCLTLLFGLPLVLLPCREAAVSIPGLVQTCRQDHLMVEKFQRVAKERESGSHLLINGIDFDEEDPLIVAEKPQLRHSSALLTYESTNQTRRIDEITTPVASHDSNDDNDEECATLRETCIHVGSTLLILGITYFIAIIVPGVASVWSIFGSSMAIWIAFIVPTACYLKIREHKGANVRAIIAFCLLVFSTVAAFVCTRQAVSNAMEGSAVVWNDV